VHARAKALPTLEKVLARAQGTIESPHEKPKERDDDELPVGSKEVEKTADHVVEKAEEILSDI
jgi:hypothetical protein